MNTNSTQPFATYTLHFIRKNGSSSTNDDKITIQPKWRSLDTNDDISLLEYQVSAEFAAQSMSTNRTQKSTMRLLGNGLIQYLEAMLNLALLDSEPFESIQIDAPCIPSVLLPLTTVSTAVEYILQSVQVCLHNWPTVEKPAASCNAQASVNITRHSARHIVFEDEASNRRQYNNY